MRLGPVSWRWTWLLPVAVLVVIGLVLVAAYLGKQDNKRKAFEAIAHNGFANNPDPALVFSLKDDLTTEGGHEQLRKWKRLNRFASSLITAAVLLAILLAGRPSQVDQSQESGRSRDIVLCLDVSGSALPYDRQVIEAYLGLVKDFKDERIGLSIFNSTSRTVFPLTDDYELVTQQLNHADQVLKGVQTQDDIDRMSDKQYQAVSDWLDGTQNRADTTSLIGDGLVSCAAMLPNFANETSRGHSGASEGKSHRSSSIVLATDNVTSGRPTYTLAEALKLTDNSGISVDGLYSGPRQSEGAHSTQDMRRLIENHGGIFLLQKDQDTISSLVRQIEHRHGGDLQSIQESSLVDSPGWWVLALCIVVGLYSALAWRLKR